MFFTAGLKRFVALASLVLLSLNAAATYPERPVKLLVPYAAGGPTDYLARTFAERLSKVLGQSIVIENKPGGNSIVAVNTLLQARPDGYTLVFAGLATLVLNPYLYKSLSYNADEDLAPVGVVSTMPLVMLVNKDLPVNTVQEFIQYARKNPGKVTFGTPGNGNPLHLAPLIFAKDSNIEMRSIPYSGTAPALVALLSGQIDTVFDVVQSALPHIEAGKLKPLAVTTATRNPALPNVPTLAESGFTGYDAKAWFALAAPGKTPQEVLDTLNKATQAVVSDPTFAPSLEKLGLMPQPAMDFVQIRKFIDSEKQRWGTVIRDNRISLD